MRIFALTLILTVSALPAALAATKSYVDTSNITYPAMPTGTTGMATTSGMENYVQDRDGFYTVQDPAALEEQQKEEEKPAFTQKPNNPNKQVYKGAQKKALEPPRTHHMYEPNHYQ